MHVPPEIEPLATTGGIVSAIVTLLFAPSIKARIDARARTQTHDQTGWTKAVEALETQIDDLRTEVGDLRAEVGGLRSQVAERDRRISDLQTTITEQSHSLARTHARVRQLEQAWPPAFTMPAPDPGLS